MTAARPSRVDGVADSIFAPVAVARASSAIAEQIRTAILSGRLKAGDRLSPERELAEQFGVSRVTVRDALRSLEAMGLIAVKVGARGGAFVTAPTGSKVAQTMSDMMMMSATTPEDIVEARLIVELGTVTLACARASEVDLAQLRDLCERGREALEAGNYSRELSWDFHAQLGQSAHNGAVGGLTQSFRSTLSMHPLRVREGSRAHELTVEEHLRIVEALERRDGGAARHAMADHLLRGTSLEERSAPLLEWWRARDVRTAPQASSRRSK